MYNPNSVYRAMVDHSLESYWKNTSAFGTINTYINMNYEGLKDDVMKILSRGKADVEPEKIELATPSLTLKQGEYGQIIAEFAPKPSLYLLSFSSGDDSVATVDYNGVVLAVGSGQTTMHVEAAGT